jgi:hypothetical protein
MNTQKENKYERYALGSDWNLTKDGPKKASCFILCDDAVKGIKILFGEPLDQENPDILILPHQWGMQNENIIASWFQMEELMAVHKVELGMTGHITYTQNAKDDSDDPPGAQPGRKLRSVSQYEEFLSVLLSELSTKNRQPIPSTHSSTCSWYPQTTLYIIINNP